MVIGNMECLIVIIVYSNCQQGKGGRMSQDEGNLIDLLGISSLFMFSPISLHYLIPMMSLLTS